MTSTRHFVLLGFKHVGKSTIGQALAEKLQLPFIDLDQLIEQNYQEENAVRYSCREIFRHHGENYFRAYENKILRVTLTQKSSIIALGGGAPLQEENQLLLKSHCLIHITADPEVVFSRIMSGGKPAFFPEEEDPHIFFLRLWQQRAAVYKRLATYTIDNTHSVEQTLQELLRVLESKNELCNY